MKLESPHDIPTEERLIFALDVPRIAEARRLVHLLRPEVHFFKVGLELFFTSGFEIIDIIGETGAKIFLDLKLLDIPATVLRVLRIIGDHGPGISMTTLHPQHLPFGRDRSSESFSGIKLLVVPVLTSVSDEDLADTGSSLTVAESMLVHTERALFHGFDGVIASGQEVHVLRKRFGGKPLIVTPGIRPEWADVKGDDQKRVATPRDAILTGADHIVVGRPIRDHAENQGGPLQAARRIQQEIRDALTSLSSNNEQASH